MKNSGIVTPANSRCCTFTQGFGRLFIFHRVEYRIGVVSIEGMTGFYSVYLDVEIIGLREGMAVNEMSDDRIRMDESR